MDAYQIIEPAVTRLVAQFTKRDIIIYALGIGCCNNALVAQNNLNDGLTSKNRELRYVYENNLDFEPFPTFLLSLTFQSELIKLQSESVRLGSGIRPFPPESLGDGSGSGIIPRAFFNDPGSIDGVKDLPVLHTRQTFTIHNRLIMNESSNREDTPVNVWLESRIITIDPRSIGTFVTSETKFYEIQNQCRTCVATSEMTALVLGLKPDLVRKFGPRTKKHIDELSTDKSMTKIYSYEIPRNAALIYRLSGDYNPIHVDGSNDELLKLMGRDSIKGPVLHGLCTLGYATRAVLEYAENDICTSTESSQIASIQCNFIKPVFVGDCIKVIISDQTDMALRSNQSLRLCFKVYRALDQPHGSVIGNNLDTSTELVIDGDAILTLNKRRIVNDMDTTKLAINSRL